MPRHFRNFNNNEKSEKVEANLYPIEIHDLIKTSKIYNWSEYTEFIVSNSENYSKFIVRKHLEVRNREENKNRSIFSELDKARKRASLLGETILEIDLADKEDNPTVKEDNPTVKIPNGEFLIRLISGRENFDNVMASIEEQFYRDVDKFGLKKAKFAYWREVASEIFQIIPRGLLSIFAKVLGKGKVE